MARILVADDEALIAFDIKNRPAARGHDIVGIARSGKDAVRLCHELKPDLVLMDICMDYRTDGIDACRAIKSEDSGIGVVFVSCYLRESFSAELEGIAFDGFVSKFQFEKALPPIAL